MTFHVTYNFVQGYDAGQKKIVASEMDQNFADIESAINDLIESADKLPVGTIIWSGNASAPAGYLLCNGSAVGRDTYPELFAAIGTTYGDGDGSTTFNLPNLIGRFLEGASTAGTVKAAGLPNISGSVTFHNGGTYGPISGTVGSFATDGQMSNYALGSGGESPNAYAKFAFDASSSSSIYGNSTTVQPPSLTALPCIKY